MSDRSGGRESATNAPLLTRITHLATASSGTPVESALLTVLHAAAAGTLVGSAVGLRARWRFGRDVDVWVITTA